jgi:hypothetical protein
MALRQLGSKGGRELCPRCGSEPLLFIEGTFIKWATCPKCRYKKLLEKEKTGPRVVSLK